MFILFFSLFLSLFFVFIFILLYNSMLILISQKEIFISCYGPNMMNGWTSFNSYTVLCLKCFKNMFKIRDFMQKNKCLHLILKNERNILYYRDSVYCGQWFTRAGLSAHVHTLSALSQSPLLFVITWH